MDCVQRQGKTTIMLAIRVDCELLVALDSEEWTALMFSVDRGVGEMVTGQAVAGAQPSEL